jgi:transcriptional regulator with XRE-family HTH domain
LIGPKHRQTANHRGALPTITWRVMGEAQDVGRVLKRLREGAGLSQRVLAEQLGVQQPAVARWEAGGVQMSINRIDEILAHFGYGVEYDLKAVPINEALTDGVPLQMVRRRPAGPQFGTEGP